VSIQTRGRASSAASRSSRARTGGSSFCQIAASSASQGRSATQREVAISARWSGSGGGEDMTSWYIDRRHVYTEIAGERRRQVDELDRIDRRALERGRGAVGLQPGPAQVDL